jgi:hypothetical protein
LRTKEAFFAMKTNYKPNVSNVLPIKDNNNSDSDSDSDSDSNSNSNSNSTNSYVVSVEERRQPSGCLRN